MDIRWVIAVSAMGSHLVHAGMFQDMHRPLSLYLMAPLTMSVYFHSLHRSQIQMDFLQGAGWHYWSECLMQGQHTYKLFTSSSQSLGWLLSKMRKITCVGEDVETLQPSGIVTEKAKWRCHHGKQYGGSSKS